MSLRNNQENWFPSSSSEIQDGEFGLFHVSFKDKNGTYILPIEDRESIEASLEFYRNNIKSLKRYPVFENGDMIWKPGEDEKVLIQVIGLPTSLSSLLNWKEDLLSQLNFREGLFPLKQEAYSSTFKNGQWFLDDFKLFCLKNGFFFLYDETKPFLNDTAFPCFINRKRMSDKYQYFCDTSFSQRLVIDFTRGELNSQFYSFIKKLDSFSFEERIDYFINGISNPDIESEIPSEQDKEDYTLLLKKYFISIINALFDDYCFTVLRKVTKKMSYLSIAKTFTDHDVYCLSSYQEDLYSIDGKHFFFAESQKEKIKKLILDAVKKDFPDVVTLYASLGFPFEGFRHVITCDQSDAEEVFSHLPFAEVKIEDLYMTVKRADEFYSYLAKEMEHQSSFDRRVLAFNGLSFSSIDFLLNNDDKVPFSISFSDELGPVLSPLFSKKGYSLEKKLLPAFSILSEVKVSDQLHQAVKKLDAVTSCQALSIFFHFFKSASLESAVNAFLTKYDLMRERSTLMMFFHFLLGYPFLLVRHAFRMECLEGKNILPLLVLDGISDDTESYEIALPYPYVTYGMMAYSFQKGLTSKPYLCSCQKTALYHRYEFFKEFDDDGNAYSTNRNAIFHLGLPENILNSISINSSKDVISLLPFKEGLCHLCNHSIPNIFDSIEKEDRNNCYSVYIRSKASEKGVYIDDFIPMDEISKSFFDNLKKKHSSFLYFDRKYVDPILLPYINISKQMILSLLCSFYPEELRYDDFVDQLFSFSSLDSHTIQRMMFDYHKDRDLDPMSGYLYIFLKIFTLYKMLEKAYALYVSSDTIPTGEENISLNFDYNPKLKHPYVLLGRYFNAYCDHLNDEKYYLCQEDKEAMLHFGSKYANYYDSRYSDKSLKIPYILGMLGFPYLVILKYSSFDSEKYTFSDLLQAMDFEKGIGRRQERVSHAAYLKPFVKAFPLQLDKKAEFIFTDNAMMSDGFRILSDRSLYEIYAAVDSDFDLDNPFASFPFLECSTNEIPEVLFTHFKMGRDKLKELLAEFETRSRKMEIIAYMSAIVLDAYYESDDVFLEFFFFNQDQVPIRSVLDKYFPQISRVREEAREETRKKLAWFLIFLLEKLISHYVQKERYIGG